MDLQYLNKKFLELNEVALKKYAKENLVCLNVDAFKMIEKKLLECMVPIDEFNEIINNAHIERKKKINEDKLYFAKVNSENGTMFGLVAKLKEYSFSSFEIKEYLIKLLYELKENEENYKSSNNRFVLAILASIIMIIVSAGFFGGEKTLMISPIILIILFYNKISSKASRQLDSLRIKLEKEKEKGYFDDYENEIIRRNTMEANIL